MIGNVDFRDYTREEAILYLRNLEDPKLEPLIVWIAESTVLSDSYHAIRVVLADAEKVARQRSLEPHIILER